MKIFLLAVALIAIPLILLLVVPHILQNAFAWGWGPRPGEWLVGGPESEIYQPVAYSNGYYAGQQDAIYDHGNNLAYNPIGQCLSCHSELYWSGFYRGYNTQWNSYQAQGTRINIYGNNNYVNTNQYSGQDQDQQGGPGPNSDFNPPSPNCLGSCDNGGGPDS